MKNFAMFVDVNNLYHGSLEKYQSKLDYRKFAEHLIQEHGHMQFAYAYDLSNSGDFRSMLRHIGFECQWSKVDYNWNVNIAMDVMRQLDRVDLIIIGSNDVHLAPLAEYVKHQGVKCYCYGFNICEELRTAVHRFIEIPEELLHERASKP
jgi:uncharacterized LabA/DUF88 family protein